MLTVRAAAQLLGAAESLDGLDAIAAALGAAAPSGPLDEPTRRALGLADGIVDARVSVGPGALRLLLARAAPRESLATLLPRLASRLATRAPHVLWLLAVVQPETNAIAIAAWADDRRPPRIAALIADRTRIVDSDADTLRALAAATSDRDLLTHSRWIDVLGRESLTARFYRSLERAVATLAQSSHVGPDGVRRELALLHTSRLLFLSFLEAKGWLDGDRAFLTHQYDRCVAARGRFHDRVLCPLFFGTLNTPHKLRARAARAFGRIPFLNGGLFARAPLERAHSGVAFSDEAFGSLIYDLFAQYRFTAREETADWNEAAIDPEMLGKAFESLMASAERRRTGAFFTPFALVERVADAGLDAALGQAPALADVERLTVLDPACGSGAFLVHVLERLSSLRVRHGDTRDLGAIRADVLTRSIFGVDVNPTAVWLCQLRLWLSVVIESAIGDPDAVTPLPNLDRNIRVGDALSGRAFADIEPGRGAAGLGQLRERYARATGVRKRTLAKALDRSERACAIALVDSELSVLRARRRDLVVVRRGRDLFGDRRASSASEHRVAGDWRRRAADLRSLRRRIATGGALPFSFGVHFADVAARGGFDLVVGNPPWVRLHRIDAAARAAFRRDFVVARAAAWESGAAQAGAAKGFAGQVDVAALFVERSLRLLSTGGTLTLLVPTKLWCSLAGGGVRRLIASETRLRRLEDYSEALTAFDAAVYPSLIVAQRPSGDVAVDAEPDIHVAVSRNGGRGAAYAWHEQNCLALDASAGAPWILLPPDPRREFDRLARVGQALASSPVGRPHLGVKCGCNEAFIVGVDVHGEGVDDDDLAEIRDARGECVLIERHMLRPLVRGEQLRRWNVAPAAHAIIWPHDARGAPMQKLPPYAARWFARWRSALVGRADARHASRWWTLFRTESVRLDRPRVVWGDLGREPRASVLLAGDATVALNSCYVARCRDLCDADALAALLNGAIARAWLNSIAEPARGGYRRYFGWTLSLLPVPRDWARARELLAPLGAAARAAAPPSDQALFDATLEAYGLARDSMASLVGWSCA